MGVGKRKEAYEGTGEPDRSTEGAEDNRGEEHMRPEKSKLKNAIR